MTLGYPTNDMGWKIKGRGYRVNKCIFHTNDYIMHVLMRIWLTIRRGFELYECLLVNSSDKTTNDVLPHDASHV